MPRLLNLTASAHANLLGWHRAHGNLGCTIALGQGCQELAFTSSLLTQKVPSLPKDSCICSKLCLLKLNCTCWSSSLTNRAPEWCEDRKHTGLLNTQSSPQAIHCIAYNANISIGWSFVVPTFIYHFQGLSFPPFSFHKPSGMIRVKRINPI